MRDVEDAYWELYFCYRDLEARRVGEASALETWRQRQSRSSAIGGEGGEANTEAQSRSQYFLFETQVEVAQTNLFRVENRLRYLMGLAASDGRLIRPSDEPTIAPVKFDWATIHAESLARREELRRQKWTIKRRELELIAAKNQLLPRLDAGRPLPLARRRRRLDRRAAQRHSAVPRRFERLRVAHQRRLPGMGSRACSSSMPLGFRRGMTTVRHSQLLLARERAVLQDMELSVSHQLADAIRDLDLNYGTTQTNFNRRAAAEDEVKAVARFTTSAA